MPARSKSQQRLFGMIHAIQKGTLSSKKVSPEIRRMARTIDPESVSHFAETSHKSLPEKKDSEKKAFYSGFSTRCSEFGVDPVCLIEYIKSAQAKNTDMSLKSTLPESTNSVNTATYINNKNIPAKKSVYRDKLIQNITRSALWKTYMNRENKSRKPMFGFSVHRTF